MIMVINNSIVKKVKLISTVMANQLSKVSSQTQKDKKSEKNKYVFWCSALTKINGKEKYICIPDVKENNFFIN